MDLIYTELKTETLTQEITPTEDMNLVYCRPHLIKRGSPGGSVRLQVLDSNGFLIGESGAVTVASIVGVPHFHGYVRFDLTVPLRSGAIYKIGIKGEGGYVFSESNHIGICQDFDLRKVTASYSPNDTFTSAFDIELWGRNQMSRTVEFLDGFTSSAVPTLGTIQATSIFSAANDAGFVTVKGAAAALGDIYHNSTTGLMRKHNGTAFFNLANQLIEETSFVLANNVGPLDVTGFVLDKTANEEGLFYYNIHRRVDGDEREESGTIHLMHKNEAATWELSRKSEFDTDVGVIFTVTASGQVQYTSDNFVGANYAGTMKFQSINTFKP